MMYCTKSSSAFPSSSYTNKFVHNTVQTFYFAINSQLNTFFHYTMLFSIKFTSPSQHCDIKIVKSLNWEIYGVQTFIIRCTVTGIHFTSFLLSNNKSKLHFEKQRTDSLEDINTHENNMERYTPQFNAM